eukprot:4648581-Pleurochrysis_carterae.AAC.1
MADKIFCTGQSQRPVPAKWQARPQIPVGISSRDLSESLHHKTAKAKISSAAPQVSLLRPVSLALSIPVPPSVCSATHPAASHSWCMQCKQLARTNLRSRELARCWRAHDAHGRRRIHSPLNSTWKGKVAYSRRVTE